MIPVRAVPGMVVPVLLVAFAALLQPLAVQANAWETDDKLRTCTRCHDEGESHPVLSILKTPHAVVADPGTPFAQEGCASCHGASEQHMRAPGDAGRAPPDISFKEGGATPVARQNAVCLDCHEGSTRMHWRGSTHEMQDVGCVGCHDLHTGHDAVLAKDTQTIACFGCHAEKRAEIMRPSSHPILEGKVACSDCHNPHGSVGPSNLTERTVNETCYTCHAEKRGPFLWEHPPAREDCTICHKPHGSVHPALLTHRGPWLCQQCHIAQQHPSTAYSGTGLPGESIPSGAQQVLGKNCMNCHSQVHGSNHPSGPRLTR
ncbi:MAG TPA: DmsE family decaheme c-type cytochrome [Xanthomonadaceae bacterium]|nr:DmsE family decaheme c-type cytochrome [Xanthomonadaceae bacterium]